MVPHEVTCAIVGRLGNAIGQCRLRLGITTYKIQMCNAAYIEIKKVRVPLIDVIEEYYAIRSTDERQIDDGSCRLNPALTELIANELNNSASGIRHDRCARPDGVSYDILRYNTRKAEAPSNIYTADSASERIITRD